MSAAIYANRPFMQRAVSGKMGSFQLFSATSSNWSNEPFMTNAARGANDCLLRPLTGQQELRKVMTQSFFLIFT